jgi:hypothetical protein
MNRARSHIANHAPLANPVLIYSSGLVEKANDLVVAKRQRHNGMSWSKEGSVGLDPRFICPS